MALPIRLLFSDDRALSLVLNEAAVAIDGGPE